MTKWKLETNDDGDEVLIFDESHSLVAWNLEDTDKCCYEILHLIVAAPELLRVCQEAVEDIRNCGELTLGTINNLNEVIRDAKMGKYEFPSDWRAIYGDEMEELSV